MSEAIPSRAELLAAEGGLEPVVLPSNQLRRFYRGGARIARLRGHEATDAGGPEDWVGSAATSWGSQTEGLSRLPDGRYLRDAIQADPPGFLGVEHVRRWGSEPGLLVKLLDAGERLGVHFHPGRPFAREALHLNYGKTESWIIVEANEGAAVYLGLNAPVERATIAKWTDEQDIAAMLDAMNEVPVKAGDALLVPAGTLHAIGSGILLVELQEPTDLSVLLEWQRFGVDDGSETLGLGWDRVLEAVDTGAMPELEPPAIPADLADGITELLPPAADPYFRAQRIVVEGEPVQLDPSYAVLVMLEGSATLWSDPAVKVELRSGDNALIPHGVGSTTLDGHATLIRCRPPAPDAGPGRW
jgi:mannose-6-phosphate isomerase